MSTLEELFLILKGGFTSGNWGHSGIPGHHGGSKPGGGFGKVGIKPNATQADKNLFTHLRRLDRTPKKKKVEAKKVEAKKPEVKKQPEKKVEAKKPEPKKEKPKKEDTSSNAEIFKQYPNLKALGDQLDVKDAHTQHVQKQLQELNQVPASVMKKLAEKGVKVYVGNKPFTELDSNQKYKGVVPRGWPPGSSWDDLAGGYDYNNKAVIIGKGVGKGKGGSVSVALHELGHAVHHTLKENDKALSTMHTKVYEKLPNYLRQGGPGGSAGISEMFAESWAMVTKGETLRATKEFSPEIVSYMKGIK